jgi:hypothetical protein
MRKQQNSINPLQSQNGVEASGRRTSCRTILIAAALMFGGCASDYRLYGTDPSGLWEIDRGSAEATLIGATEDSLAGLACSEASNKLYAVSSIKTGSNVYGDSRLYSVNAQTGQTMVIGNVGHAISGLAFDNGTDVLYGVNILNELFTIDTGTGAGTLLGPPGRQWLQSLAFYPYSGWLYSADRADGTFYRVDPDTLSGATNGITIDSIRSMTYDPEAKTAFAVRSDILYEIIISTGQATSVGSLPTSGFNGLASCEQ